MARTARAASNAALVGGAPLTSGIDTPKTIANFWPYATTLFDFTRRAMPWQQPRTLTDDEVYALTAYILALNKIVGENAVMNAETLPKVRMPNRDGFIVRFPERDAVSRKPVSRRQPSAGRTRRPTYAPQGPASSCADVAPWMPHRSERAQSHDRMSRRIDRSD